MANIYRALSFSFIERFALIAVALISSVVIARVLTPAEIGIYSVAAALIAIGQVVREFGVGNFLIQEKNLTTAHIRTAFGLSFLIGGTLFLAFALGAPWAGQFYKDERMTWIVRVVALNFLVMPFCSISLALLRRDMQFGRLMSVNIAAATAGAMVTLGLAFANWGPASLAWGAIAVNVVTGAGAWLARKDNKLLLPALSEWRKVLAFGSQSAGAAVITTIAMDINDLVVGRVLGFAPTAIISRANGLVNMFNQQIMGAVRSVALPAFARAYRENQPLEPIYVASVTTVTAIAWPFYGFVALHATDILRLMFGPQWDAAARLVPIFCLAGALTATCSLALTLAIAIGRNQAAVKTDLIVQPIRAAILVAAVLWFKSLEALAWAALLVNLISTPFFWWVKNRLLPTDTAGMKHGLRASLLLCLACLFIPVASVLIQNDGVIAAPSGTVVTLIHSVAALIAWVLALFWLGHPLSRDHFVLKVRANAVAVIPVLGALLPLKD
jgi:lipopolysaccharide exporter